MKDYKTIKEVRENGTVDGINSVAIAEPFIARVEGVNPVDTQDLNAGGTIDFVISDDTKDSYGDIVRVEGADLSRFMKNPVVLFAHNSRGLPVAKAVDVSISGKELLSTAEFPSVDIYQMGNTVYKMLVNKFLNAVSIGFRILDYEPIDPKEPFGAWDIKKFLLMEYSVVPIPANPNALQKAYDTLGSECVMDFAVKLLDIGAVDYTEAFRKLMRNKVSTIVNPFEKIKLCGTTFCNNIDNKETKNYDKEGSPEDALKQDQEETSEDKKMFIHTRDHDEEIEVRKTTGVDITEHSGTADVIIDIVDYKRSTDVDNENFVLNIIDK